MEYQWQEGMGEISGFGGGYEEMCRKMLFAGLAWLDANPNANPEFRGYTGIYGIITETNEDAESLSEAILEPSERGATGAMHQAVVGACLYVKREGWDAYVEAMSAPPLTTA